MRFRATSQTMHDTVMAEFGVSLVDDSVETEAARDEIVTRAPDMSSGTTRDASEIELEEFQSPATVC